MGQQQEETKPGAAPGAASNRTLAFSSRIVDLSRCGSTVVEKLPSTSSPSSAAQNNGADGRTGSKKNEPASPSSLAPSSPTRYLTRANYSAPNLQKHLGTHHPLGNLLMRQRKEPKYPHQAFPFGFGEMPFRSKRKGGSINIPTTVFRNKTKVPMGLAGMTEMARDAAHTHLDPYCSDRYGKKNFHLSEHAMKAAGANSVLEQIAERPLDDLDRLVLIDCKNARYMQ
ncbi:unnamed protein product [Amoebophrya sp. A25]|nr:unnamed protein product [Amoebophrya sp. A25]|eukprot:GSA25T00011202001.1